MVLSLLVATQGLRAVTPLPVGSLLRYKGHYFNLQHRRLRFIPRGGDGYELTVAPYPGRIDRGAPIGKPPDPHTFSWRTRLPFSFAFAGKKWDEVIVNGNGSLTFGVPEAASYPERESWSDGTMRWMASAFDVRAITGERPMIVPLWGLNSAGSTRIFTRSARDAFTVTWQAGRYQSANEGYTPLGESNFQVRLGRDGSIEFRYGSVAEKDGIVGVFPGGSAAGKPLDHVELPPTAKLQPEEDLRHAEVEDRGADLRFLLTFAAPIPGKLASGTLHYSVVALSEGEVNVLRLKVDSAGARNDPACVVLIPHERTAPTDCVASTLAAAAGNTIEFYLPRIALKNPSSVYWRAQVGNDTAEDPIVSTGELRPVSLSAALPSGFDFARGGRLAPGNVYEVFHYPFLSKARTVTFQEIYKHVPAKDDLAVAFTDFRIDDIHNHGASSSAGGEYGDLREMFNSAVLQQAAGPVFLGPRFREVIQEDGRTFRHYPFAVSWVAHEMTHRWVATLRWKNTDPMALQDTVQKWHWSQLLYTPVVTPVAPYFADSSYPEESIMGGMTTVKLPDGKEQSRIAPFGAPSGLCALDLYSMGLIGPEEVPETFFISGAVPDGNGGLSGGDAVPVTIADIVAANGPRVPAAKDAQHRFRFEVYLLHEDGREPDAATMAQVRGIQAEVIQYFTLATNGRMTVVPTR